MKIDHVAETPCPHHLRLSFEAARLRQAVALAAELRACGPDAIDVRPARGQRLRGSWWTVAVTMPAALPAPAVIQRAEQAMRAGAARFPGSRFVGDRPGPGPGPPPSRRTPTRPA